VVGSRSRRGRERGAVAIGEAGGLAHQAAIRGTAAIGCDLARRPRALTAVIHPSCRGRGRRGGRSKRRTVTIGEASGLAGDAASLRTPTITRRRARTIGALTTIL